LGRKEFLPLISGILVAENTAKEEGMFTSWFLSLRAVQSALFSGSFYLKWHWTTPETVKSKVYY